MHQPPRSWWHVEGLVRYVATWAYPGTVAVSLDGEMVTASRPGLPDVEANNSPCPSDPFTYKERAALLRKAAAALSRCALPQRCHLPAPAEPAGAVQRTTTEAVFAWPGVLRVYADPAAQPLAISIPGRPWVADLLAMRQEAGSDTATTDRPAQTSARNRAHKTDEAKR